MVGAASEPIEHGDERPHRIRDDDDRPRLRDVALLGGHAAGGAERQESPQEIAHVRARYAERGCLLTPTPTLIERLSLPIRQSA